MRYRGSKLKKPEIRNFYGIFYHLNEVKSKYKGLPECMPARLPYNLKKKFRAF